MKRTWKRIGSLFMAVCMALTMLPMTAFAADDMTAETTPTYTATLNIQLNGEPSGLFFNVLDDVLTLKLSTDESQTVNMTAANVDTWTATVQNGTWKLYVNDEYYGVTITVNNGPASVTMDWITINTGIIPQGTATGGTIDTNGVTYSSLAFLKGDTVTFTASGAGAASYTYAWTGTHNGNPINGTGNTYTIDSVQGMVSIACTITGIGTVQSSITTASELKAALERTTPAIISVTEDIEMTGTITLGASHTLNIEEGVTISTRGTGSHDCVLQIPQNMTLTLAGPGTLKSDNVGTSGIIVWGTLRMETHSRLLAANSGGSGIGLGVNDIAGKLLNNGGHITLQNSGANSYGISNSGSGSEIVLNDGTLIVSNTGDGSRGITGTKLTATDCAITVNNGGNSNSRGINASAAFTLKNSSLTISNSAGDGLLGSLSAEGSTITVQNSGSDSRGINIDSGYSMMLKNNSILNLENTTGTGLSLSIGPGMTVDCSAVNVKAGGIGFFRNIPNAAVNGLNSGRFVLNQNAKLSGVNNLFYDQGFAWSNSNGITVAASGVSPSSDGLTAGEYVWDGIYFTKNSVAAPIEITGFASIPDVNVGKAGNASCANASEVMTILPWYASAVYSGNQTIDWSIASWEDTDGYDPNKAGSYTFTATLSTSPAGYSNSSGHQVTVEVVVSPASSGNGGGSGGGSSTTPVSPAAPAPSTTGSTATATVTSTTGADGKAAASVPAAQIDSALKQAQDAAVKSGNAPKVEIKVEAPANAATVETAVPQAAMTAIASGKLQDMTISSPVANLTFDGAALNTIAGAAAGDVKFSSSKVDAADLPAAVQTLLGNRPVYEFSVTSGGNTISQFGGNVTVAVPYQLSAGENPNAVIISFINASGNLEIVTNGRYDEESGTVVFTTDHFSRYAVGYNKVGFNDVKDKAWYANAVSFLAARGITGGTTATTFSPDAKLTRGQFITMLMKAYGIEPDGSSENNFSDAGDTYYTGYLAAAKRLGISTGVGDNKFAPKRAITRQEMFTLLYNALKALDELPAGDSDKTLADFADSGSVADWATEALSALTESGTVAGSSGKLDPMGASTRAQMAQVLYNLLGK